MKTVAIKLYVAAKVNLTKLIPLASKFLKFLISQRNPFTPCGKEFEQARLMGMYLSQTNRKQPYDTPWLALHERHRGRHFRVREYGSALSR